MSEPAPIEVIATSKTWIESAALDQLKHVATLPSVERVVGMPDLHPGGGGAPVGAAFVARSLIYPHLVGNDIGCGMRVWDTGLPLRKLKLDRLEKKLELDDGAPELADVCLQHEAARSTGYEYELDTVGRGNHFAELVKVDRIVDAVAFDALAADARNTWLLVHSGSRALGHEVNREHVDRWAGQGVDPEGAAGAAYLDAHDNAVRWARANRRAVALRFDAALGASGRRLLDITHNSVQRAPHDAALWLHRKGAAPADVGPVIIPGSRGDLSYVVAPRGDGSRNLASLAHGAGRKWARADTKGKLGAKADAGALQRTRFGSRVICESKALLFEEAPEAYKPIASVIDALLDAGVITVIAELSPLLTYKTKRLR